MVWKLTLVSHQIFIGTNTVLLQLVIEGLSGYLNTDAQYYLDIDYLLFQGGIQYPQMSLP